MRRALALLAALAAGPAQALSCLPPDAVRLYQTAEAAKAPFYIVAGEVEVTGPVNLPDPDDERPAITQARITGTGLSGGGFEVPFDQPVTLEISCLGPWCGGVDGLTGKLIVAVAAGEAGLTLRIGPCGGDVVRWTADGEARLLACHRDGDCRLKQF